MQVSVHEQQARYIKLAAFRQVEGRLNKVSNTREQDTARGLQRQHKLKLPLYHGSGTIFKAIA